MPPKVRKTSKQAVDKDPNLEILKIENEKENVHSKLRTRRKCNYKDSDLSPVQEDDFKKPFAVSQNPDIPSKAKGFWSIKLKNLEPNKDDLKEKKSELYEFSISDEFSPVKLKKKKSRQPVKQKKKQQPVFPCATRVLKSKSKAYEEHRKSMVREQIILNREKENLADKNDKFTFSTLMPCVGVTSTPAVCKANLIGASNFMFLSPVQKDETDVLNYVNFETPIKSNTKLPDGNVCTEIKTPKRETRLERVLRTRKVVV